MARDGFGPPGDRRPRRTDSKLEWLERTGDGRSDGDPGGHPGDSGSSGGSGTSGGTGSDAVPAKAPARPADDAETSLFAAVPPMSTPTPPMTRREARAREQARSAEQIRRGNEQEELSRRRAAEQVRGDETGVIRPVRSGPSAPAPAPSAPPSAPSSASQSASVATARTSPPPPSRPEPAPAAARTSVRGTAPPSARPSAPRPPKNPKPPKNPGPPKNPVMTAALLVAALALLAWAGVSFVAAPLPGTHVLAASAPLVTVLALPVIALSAGRRNLVSGLLAGLAAVVPWTVVAGYAEAGPGPTVAGTSGSSLRLMFLDASEASADPGSITAVARAQGVDVVVMTGLSDAFSHDLAVAGLNRLVTPRWVSMSAGNADGIGVWSRQGTATLDLVPGTKLPVGQGLLTTPAGTVDLVVAQLPGSVLAPGAGWRDQLQHLGRLPALSRDRVLVGDLNATPWNPAFRSFTGKNWHDAADIVGRGLRPTWPAWSPLPVTPTDHVLVSEGMGASAADTFRVRGTSHRAMIVTLVVPK